MLQEAADKLLGFKRHCFGMMTFGVLIPKGNFMTSVNYNLP